MCAEALRNLPRLTDRLLRPEMGLVCLRQSVPGVMLIRPDVYHDPRGSLIKTLHKEQYLEAGLNWRFAEEYYSISMRSVLRGMHFQLPPHDHAKLVYCL